MTQSCCWLIFHDARAFSFIPAMHLLRLHVETIDFRLHSHRKWWEKKHDQNIRSVNEHQMAKSRIYSTFFCPKKQENSYLHFFLCFCYFVLPAWITCGWDGREWNRDKKWRINVFAENRLNIAGGIVVFATFYHCHCIVTTLHFKRNSHPHVKMNGFFVFAREHFQFISTIQVTFWLH